MSGGRDGGRGETLHDGGGGVKEAGIVDRAIASKSVSHFCRDSEQKSVTISENRFQFAEYRRKFAATEYVRC